MRPMFLSGTYKKMLVTPIFPVLFLLVFPAGTWAMDSEVLETKEPQTLQLVVGKSIVLKSTKPAERVSIADPEIADFVLISPHEIYITGKAPGITNLTLWKNKEISAIYDLVVDYDTSRLKQKLHEILPEETDLRVLATHDSITLSGEISSAANLSQAMAVAQAYAREGRIRNLIEVGGVQQVMIEVRVAEMQRSVLKRLGFNFNFLTSSGKFGISKLAGLTEVVRPDDANILTPGAPFGIFVSPAVNALFRFSTHNTSWTGFIDALKEDGLAKILAEPTLIALSGHEAYFLAGGEFPVPVPQGLGTVAIEYKSFGVGLKFMPTVLSGDKINIRVALEVSELDFSTAVQFQGFVVPGLSTRKAETVVELSDGQSFAIAGLLRESVRDVMHKFPLLGDIPILGALFRSRTFQKNESELVIIATPHLVKPLDMAKQTLPTDYYSEPKDAEIYIWGLMEREPNPGPSAFKGELEGDFGHVVPKLR